MGPLDVARQHRAALLAIAERRGVSNIRVVLDGPGALDGPSAAGPGPLRLLVDFDRAHTGLDFFGFAEEAEATVGMRVEIGTGYDPAVALTLEPL